MKKFLFEIAQNAFYIIVVFIALNLFRDEKNNTLHKLTELEPLLLIFIFSTIKALYECFIKKTVT